jgi:hypothetical protein
MRWPMVFIQHHFAQQIQGKVWIMVEQIACIVQPSTARFLENIDEFFLI